MQVGCDALVTLEIVRELIETVHRHIRLHDQSFESFDADLRRLSLRRIPRLPKRGHNVDDVKAGRRRRHERKNANANDGSKKTCTRESFL